MTPSHAYPAVRILPVHAKLDNLTTRVIVIVTILNYVTKLAQYLDYNDGHIVLWSSIRHVMLHSHQKKDMAIAIADITT